VAESKLKAALKDFMDELAHDVVEERVVDYAIREVRAGRKLAEVLKDPYVKNRLSEDKVSHVLENPEIVAVVEEQISEAFRTKDFGFID
jgi:hypothetical protein